jgi:hypothetical protein
MHAGAQKQFLSSHDWQSFYCRLRLLFLLENECTNIAIAINSASSVLNQQQTMSFSCKLCLPSSSLEWELLEAIERPARIQLT